MYVVDGCRNSLFCLAHTFVISHQTSREHHSSHTHTNTYTQHTHNTHTHTHHTHKHEHKDILRPLRCPSVRSLFVKIERYQQFTNNNRVYFPCDADQGLSPVLDQGDHAALRHGAPPVLHPDALRRNWVRLKGLFTQKIKFASTFIAIYQSQYCRGYC